VIRLRWLSALLLCLLATLPAVGQSTTKPAATQALSPADQALENQVLRVPDDGKSGSNHTSAAAAAASSASELSRIAIALVAVIGVIFLLRAGVRQMTAMPGTARAGKLVTVLSRSMISPRQHVLVLQVGKRLLVVGDSGGRMNSLCEISDPDEIALMVGQTNKPLEGAERTAGSFLSIFKRANVPFGEAEALQAAEEEPAKPIDPDEAVSSEEMNGLMDKVRMLQEQFRVKS
jgi:flagellar biogenesis protein FliO